MAKPKHGRWNNYARQSSSVSKTSHSQRPLAASPSWPPFPSSALLSALAVIATAPSVVAGSPLPPSSSPPSFLCPFIERDSINSTLGTSTSPPCTPVPSTSTQSSTPTLSPQYTKRDVIADRYVEGSDSRWRKTDQWTLYGSTCCSSSTTTTSALQSQPLQTSTPMPTSSSSTAAFDTSALPAGWDNATSSSSSTESTIILSLAIVLAGSICVFMTGCLVWRRRKKRSKDLERKLGQKHGDDVEPQESVREKEARGKMRMWVKASARWRSSVRQSARRRKKRPLSTSIANQPLSPTFGGSQVSVVPPSASSRRGSCVPGEADSSRSDILPLDDALVRPVDVQLDPPRIASPPTYGASVCVSNASSPSPSGHLTRCGDQEDEPIPYTPRLNGHVATDDKAQLAHMQLLASSPPCVHDPATSSTAQAISAPDWHEVEDDLDSSSIDLSEVPVPFHDFGLPPFFPLPPSKADVPCGFLDDRNLPYDEGDDILVSLSTHALPGSTLENPPSEPSIDYPGLEPSAPCLEGEDDLFQDWNGASFYTEALTPTDQDSTFTGVAEPSIPPSVSSISCASSPPMRETTILDSSLPQYRP